jgi:hypothetical protein
MTDEDKRFGLGPTLDGHRAKHPLPTQTDALLRIAELLAVYELEGAHFDGDLKERLLGAIAAALLSAELPVGTIANDHEFICDGTLQPSGLAALKRRADG